MTEKIKVAARVMMLLIIGSSAEAAVCYLPSPGCGLQMPTIEPGPGPAPVTCESKGLLDECPKTLDGTLQKCEKQGECYKVSCLYSGYSNCVANSSTNYCEIDASTGCYKKAEAPAVCVGYDDNYETAQNENCSCLQCEDDASKYKCECTDPVPETCKSYGNDLTPPKIYDTLNALTCSDAQKKQKIGVIKNEEECYECVAKSCTDYGEFEQGKGNCGTNEKEEQDTSTGCYKCVEKPAESDDLCVKIVFKCNGKTCSDSDLKKIGVLDTLTYGNEDGLVRSEYSQQSTCYHKKDILEMMEKRGADYEAMPYVAITVQADVYDYNEAHQNENNYVFVDGYDYNSFVRYIAVTNHNGTLQYSLIKNNAYDSENDDIGFAVVPGEYLLCHDKLCSYSDMSNCTNDKIYECFWGDKDIQEIPSTPIEIPVELAKFNGSPKCVYYAATCYNLPQNGKNNIFMGYESTYPSRIMGNYYGFDANEVGSYIVPNYPNSQIAKDCISSARIEVTDSGDASRNNTLYTMTQMTTEQLKKKYAETKNEFFNPQKDTVVLQNCELQDWDEGKFEVGASSYTEFFDASYISKYNEETRKSCSQRYFFDDAYYDMENNKVTLGYYNYFDTGVCLDEVNELIEYTPGYPANGNFTYFPLTYNFAYSGGYDFLTFEDYNGRKNFKELKNTYEDNNSIKKGVNYIMLQGTLYPTISLSSTYTSREYVYNGYYCQGTDTNGTQESAVLTASRPITTDLTVVGYGSSITLDNNIRGFGKKGYKHYEYTKGNKGYKGWCNRYDAGHWTEAKNIGKISISRMSVYPYNNDAVCQGVKCDYFFTDDNYFYYWNK